jgi:predicted ATPase
MKIKKITITNFRQFDSIPFELDFRDYLGRVRPVTLFVGANGSGKTSALDAIWFGLKAQIGYDLLRPLRTEPRYIVHTGADFAQVDYELESSEQEVERLNAWKDELIRLGEPVSQSLPREQIQLRDDYALRWTYPAQNGMRWSSAWGGYDYQHADSWRILKGRAYVSRLRSLKASSVPDAHLAGGIFFFDQERRILSEPIKQYTAQEDDDSLQFNLRKALIDWGLKAQAGRFPRDRSWYHQIQEAFNAICVPKRMGEVVVFDVDGDYEIEFMDEKGQVFTFDGLSSGERSVLYFLTSYYTRRINHSIVLIDELELHLHPAWQRRLLLHLRDMAERDNNQLIITTHSPILRLSTETETVFDFSELDDAPQPEEADSY